MKASADKAEYLTKSYFGKDKMKQISVLLEEPLKKLDQVPIDLSIIIELVRNLNSIGQGIESELFIYSRENGRHYVRIIQ